MEGSAMSNPITMRQFRRLAEKEKRANVRSKDADGRRIEGEIPGKLPPVEFPMHRPLLGNRLVGLQNLSEPFDRLI